MKDEDEKIFEKYGWTIECQSPYELRHESGSFAAGEAAWIVRDHLLELEELEASEPVIIDHLSLISPNPVTKEDELRIQSMIEALNKLKKDLKLKMVVNGKTWNL